jgi:unsaturated rhamnogalacturonyl hydrolase
MKQIFLRASILFVLCAFAGPTFSQTNEFSIDSIKRISKRCAKYRLNRGVNKLTDAYGTNQMTWDIGAYMTGVMALYRLTREQWVLDSATKWSRNANWTPNAGINTTNADDQCCEQTFGDIYLLNKNAADLTTMTKPSFDNMKQLFDVNRSTGRSRWWWSDALYMAPPAIARMYEVYKIANAADAGRLLDSMDVYWRDCAAFLYSTSYKLWFRDGGYIYPKVKTANGSPVFWSGCNAWAIAGLARVLQFMPVSHKSRGYYEQQFKDVCDALRNVPALGQDGLWRTSLLDYNQFPEKESIASAFFAFAYVWGINNGLLDKQTYEPLVRKTWSALVSNIGADGRLQWCQTINAQPDHVAQTFSAPEGEGAFMLLGEELAKMIVATSIQNMPRAASRHNGYSALKICSFTKASSFINKQWSASEIFTLQGRRVWLSNNGSTAILRGVYLVRVKR